MWIPRWRFPWGSLRQTAPCCRRDTTLRATMGHNQKPRIVVSVQGTQQLRVSKYYVAVLKSHPFTASWAKCNSLSLSQLYETFSSVHIFFLEAFCFFLSNAYFENIFCYCSCYNSNVGLLSCSGEDCSRFVLNNPLPYIRLEGFFFVSPPTDVLKLVFFIVNVCQKPLHSQVYWIREQAARKVWCFVRGYVMYFSSFLGSIHKYTHISTCIYVYI